MVSFPCIIIAVFCAIYYGAVQRLPRDYSASRVGAALCSTFKFWGPKGKKKKKVLSLPKMGHSSPLQSYMRFGSLRLQTKLALLSCFLFSSARTSKATARARGAPGH